MDLLRIACTPDEHTAGTLAPDKISAAVSALARTHGAVAFDGVFGRDVIEDLRSSFDNRYAAYFREDLHDDALPVGNRRMMLTIEISGAFNDDRLFANRLLDPVLQATLGPDFVMSGYGGVISLPGAKAQHLHRDHSTLFGDLDLRVPLPCFAITCAIPLIDMNLITGTTRLYLGGHRRPKEDYAKIVPVEPAVPAGSVLMWDYLLPHAGTPNCSDQVRPLLYFTYSRPWFRDARNYGRQQPISLPDEEYAKMAKPARRLFDWSRESTSKWLDYSLVPADAPCPCLSGRLFRDCHYEKFRRKA